MIDELHVENLALIREADLVPGAGLTVLTGETGAGKTALLSALKLLMGERADSSLVREGSDGALVEGRLFRDASDVEGMTVERRVGRDGRSRVKVDGHVKGVRELAETISPMIDLCGQHEQQRLLDGASHLEMLDAWAGDSVAPYRDAYRSALTAARAAQRELDRVLEASRTQGSRLEEARFALERIEEVGPVEGEYEDLSESLPRAEHAESLARCAHEAVASISDEGGALDAVNAAIAELSRFSSVDPKLGEIADELSGAAITMEDVGMELSRYRDSVEFDPAELAASQQRMADLKGLMRAFGPSMQDVFARRDSARELLSLVDDADARVRAAESARDEAEAALAQCARDLSRVRRDAAPRFCREVQRQMARLEMGRAELMFDIKPLPRDRWSDSGPEAYELLYRSAAGLTPRPLGKIASGGELSRVMLAAKVVLGQADGVGTLVFDEVDAGVGGSTARSLAQVLADLAKTHQVIVVTHLAQVAVVGDVHYVVRRSDGDVPKTDLLQVEGEERVVEIARLLSGDSSDASLAHARQLLEEAGSR